jgi:hypothetical protein
MRKLLLRTFGVVAGLTILSVAAGALVSKLYWGYWFDPPSVSAWVDDLRSVDAVSYLFCEPGQPARVEPLSDGTLQNLAAKYLDAPHDYPGCQLLAVLHAAGHRVPAVTPAASAAQPLCDELLRSRFIVDAEPGYEYARFVRGFLALGTRRSGDHVAVLSAIGGEVSNDHHAVYDVEFVERGAQRWEVLRHDQYFEDIAGLEGMRWFPIGFSFFTGGLALAAAASLVVWSARFSAKQLRRLRNRSW